MGQLGTASLSSVSFIFDLASWHFSSLFVSLCCFCWFFSFISSLLSVRENFLVGLYLNSSSNLLEVVGCSKHLFTCESRSFAVSFAKSSEQTGHVTASSSFLAVLEKYFDESSSFLPLFAWGFCGWDEGERKLEIWASLSFFSLILRKFSYFIKKKTFNICLLLLYILYAFNYLL